MYIYICKCPNESILVYIYNTCMFIYTCKDMQRKWDLNQKAGGWDWEEGAAPPPKAE